MIKCAKCGIKRLSRFIEIVMGVALCDECRGNGVNPEEIAVAVMESKE